MLKIFVFVMVLFTSSGPGQLSSVVGDADTCDAMVKQAQSLVGKQVPGPGGANVLVIDSQAKCLSFEKRELAAK